MKKIIITGAPRTGTTVLGDFLSYSPKILVTNELGVFDPDRNYYLERSKKWFQINKNTKSILQRKNLTEKEINEFIIGDYTNKGELEFFGDKWPTYCVDRTYCKYLVSNYPDAYYIFTYRNPFATIYSGIFRSKLQENQSHADWFFKNLEQSTNQLKTFILNWSNFIYPYVDKKIIIDYDKYVNKVDLLKADLSNFLGTDLNIYETSVMNSTSTPLDVSYTEARGIYTNSKLDAYKEGLTEEEIEYISKKIKPLELYVRDLIKKEQQLTK